MSSWTFIEYLSPQTVRRPGTQRRRRLHTYDPADGFRSVPWEGVAHSGDVLSLLAYVIGH